MIDFDATNESWKSFLEIQPTDHADFFRYPMSLGGMEYFKKMLELINKRAVKLGSMQGVIKFLESVQDKKSKALMLTWLDTYSPIRARLTKAGHEEWRVIPAYRSRCNLVNGISNPFYRLIEKPRKLDRGRGDKAEGTVIQESNLLKVDAPAVTELDFQKKLIKTSVNKFLSERSIESRTKLIAAINALPLGVSPKSGQPFIQGGAIGLKR
jgi:hypothetical protein